MTIIAAAVHAAPVFMDVEATLAKACKFIEEAGQQKIDLLVFPEVFIPGYPYFIECYPTLAQTSALVQYADCSIEVPGPETRRLQVAAQRRRLQ